MDGGPWREHARWRRDLQTYACADGKFIAIVTSNRSSTVSCWNSPASAIRLSTNNSIPSARATLLAAVIATRSRREWCDLLEGTDVLRVAGAGYGRSAHHAHNVARTTFIEIEGVVQPAPAPRFQPDCRRSNATASFGRRTRTTR